MLFYHCIYSYVKKYFVKNEFFVGCYNWQPLFLYETE